MANYTYRAKDAEGELIQGAMEAESEVLAAQRLQAMGFFPFEIQDTSPKKHFPLLDELTKKRVTLNDMTAFTRQLSDLLGAGITLVRALNVIESQTANGTLCEIIKQVKADVEKGDSLAKAFSNHPQQFSTLYCSMVRAGETGGLLSEVLRRLATFSEAEGELKGKLKSALAYPVVMILVCIAAIAIMMTVVIPRISEMYQQMDQALPAITQVLMAVSGFCYNFWWLILSVIGLALFAFRRYYRSSEGRYRVDWLLLRTPVLGSVLIKNEVARFARTFGSLLHNGVRVLPALEIVTDVLNNEVVRREVAAMPEAVSQGSGVAAALKGSRVFPPVVINMMAVGEETGKLDATLIRVADSYEGEVDRSMKALMSLLEPIIILIMGIVLGFIIMAMLMPIFQLDLGA
jgi:type II secretion system protein F